MEVRHFHSWNVSPQEALEIQRQLRARVVAQGEIVTPRLVAGADVAFTRDTAHACVVVLTFPSLDLVETVVHRERVAFPYIPGLLSFRETPALAQAFSRVRHEPEVIFIDGQGLAHPRRAGIACHLGVLLDRPTIGCAKSRLFGRHGEPRAARGSVADLCDEDGDVIGAVVRTRDQVRPVFVSVGHRISLAQAVQLTLACARRARVPEPTRQADLLAARAKRGEQVEGRGRRFD